MLNARALSAFTLILAACSSSLPLPPLAPPVAARTPAPDHTEEDVNVSLTMETSGATEFSLDNVSALLHVVEIFGDGANRALWFYSVSSRPAVMLPDGRSLLFSADLSPGIYKGPGEYELSEASGVTLGGHSGLSSGAYIETVRRLDDGTAELRRFDRFGEPCRLVVAADARTGSVDCPSLLLDTSDDQSVSVSWSWARETIEQ
jgi:hypothetical protein